MDIQGQFVGNDMFNASYVRFGTGAYIGFNADDNEIGFGTKQVYVNDDYHIIQGVYANKRFGRIRYEGQILHGYLTGLGRLTFYKNGQINPGKYEGYLKNNTFHGKGKFVFIDGRIYAGTYKDNKRLTGTETKVDQKETRICSKKYKEGIDEEC